MTVGVPLRECASPTLPSLAGKLRYLALSGLPRMYLRDERAFVFRLRDTRRGVVPEGRSLRYAAIVLIGLAREGEARARALLGETALEGVARLEPALPGMENLGDVALTLWAAAAVGGDPEPARRRLRVLHPEAGPQATVELAWSLSALCAAGEDRDLELGRRLADRVVEAFAPEARLFPHRVGGGSGGLRGHVACFADLVYPIQALAAYVKRTGKGRAREAVLACARAICRLQGDAGQWWWHYDLRSGAIVEPYPVYAVHQDAMAPMALFALESATGESFDPWIDRGLAWLTSSPELGGRSLIDEQAGLVWRKVARREPAKATRFAQAAASRLDPSLRFPGLDRLFPPGAVDREDRPYHLGWLLHAWPAARAAAWGGGGAA